MKIFTKIVLQMLDNPEEYAIIKKVGYEYKGPVALACGSTSQQNQIAQSQQNFMNQAQQQATSVFGSSSSVFNSLMSTFAPIVAAGPSQQGFSQQELANLNSQAITQTGQSYKNAKEALGEAESAQGGGTVALPSGANVGANLSLTENAANQTANELGQITQANYQQGQQNYQNAVQGELAAPGVFNPATSALNAGTSAGTAAANTANQIAQENNSWVSAVTGALGGIAGAAVGGGGILSNITKGLGNTNSSVNNPSTQAPYGNNSD